MRKLASVLALLFATLLPIAASAQTAPAPAPRPATPPAVQADSIPVGKLVAIGAGAVVGAVVIESVFVGDAAALLGAVVGGFVGSWWYDSSGDMEARVAIRRTAATSVALRLELPAESY